ncbi:MAG: hypothetical protein ACQER1_01105 [Armatimonadota bacterium]
MAETAGHILIILFAAHAALDLWLVPNQRAARALSPDEQMHAGPPGLRLPALMGLITLIAFWGIAGVFAGMLIFLGYAAIRWFRWTWRRYTCWHYLGEHAVSATWLLLIVGWFTSERSAALADLLAGIPLQFLAGATGLLVMWTAGAVAVGLLVMDLEFQPASGIPNAGRLIGQLERTLILLLVLAGVPSGIGLLIAAKSVLRFGDVSAKETDNRKMAEYVIIGTLASFTFGMPVAYAIAELMNWAQ